jgi:hypothetical protein
MINGNRLKLYKENRPPTAQYLKKKKNPRTTCSMMDKPHMKHKDSKGKDNGYIKKGNKREQEIR